MDDPASLLLLISAETAATQTTPSALSSVVDFVIVAALIFANGFFVAAEFAYVAVRKSRVEALAKDGSRSAKRLLGILDNLSAYLSAAQLGITLTSLVLGWIGEPAVAAVLTAFLGDAIPAAWLHIFSFIIAFSLITALHIVLGEQAPKLLGLQRAERVGMATALPMIVFYQVFKPAIYLLDLVSARAVRLFGIESGGEHTSIYTEEEIRHLINISEKSGHLNEEERRLIHSVFEFSETTVKEAMIPRTEIVAVPESVSLDELIKAFSESGFSRLPVTQGSLDEIAGYVHTRDLVKYIGRPEAFDLAEIIHKANYVVDNARLEDVLRQMQGEKFHFGFVVDEHGGIEGIITLEDLLEEIVGEISEEHDAEVNRQIARQPDGSCILDGGLAVRDLNRREKLNLPVSEAYTTLAGFMMSRAGQVLAVGDTVPFNGHIFEVEKMEKRRIRQIRMRKADESA